MPARAASSSTTSAGLISRKRGDTWSISITGLGDLTGYTKIYFTIKENPGDALSAGEDDDESIVQVCLASPSVSDGLLYVNKAAPASPVVAADGSITIDDLTAGDITITVKARATALCSINYGLFYDVSWADASSPAVVSTPSEGAFVLTGDVTKAVS